VRVNFQRDVSKARVTRVVVIDAEVPQDGWMGVDLPENLRTASSQPLTTADEIVIEAAPVGSSWGWPQIAAQPQPTASADAAALPAPEQALALVESASARIGPSDEDGSLTKARLENWVHRLRTGASEPPRKTDPEQIEPSRRPPRRVPDSDIIVVGRAGPAENTADASAASSIDFAASLQGTGPDRSASNPSPSSWGAASSRRILLLAALLGLAVLGFSYGYGLFSPPAIEIQSTPNERSAIT
jgi:hypothetical protein